jgi:hypothetical protein
LAWAILRELTLRATAVALELEDGANLEIEGESGLLIQRMATALSAVTGRMEPDAVSRICGPAARILAEALDREKDTTARQELARRLSALAGRMEPSEASTTLVEAIGRETDTYHQATLASTLSAVVGQMEPRERQHGSAARLPRGWLRHSTNRRKTLLAIPWQRDCRSWRVGWTLPRPPRFAAKRPKRWPEHSKIWRTDRPSG